MARLLAEMTPNVKIYSTTTASPLAVEWNPELAGTQLRLSASVLQAADRLVAPAAEVRAGIGAGVGQAACADHLHLLRSGDENRADADSICVSGADSTDRRRCLLIT